MTAPPTSELSGQLKTSATTRFRRPAESGEGGERSSGDIRLQIKQCDLHTRAVLEDFLGNAELKNFHRPRQAR